MISNHSEGGRYPTAITTSPIECCPLRKCKYAKANIHYSLCNTQRLLNKIQYLKRSIQDLETAQRQIRPVKESIFLGKRNAPCQTQEYSHTELGNVQEIVNNCIMEMTKLKNFLDDENCWWKIFKQRQFTCCEQKLPHLHGFLDGSMVTLKMLEEQMTDPCISLPRTSTPLKSKSLTSLDCKSLGHKKVDIGEEILKSYRDSSINTTQSIEADYIKSLKPCPEHCPRPCKMQKLSLLGTPKQESTIDQIEEPPKEEDKNVPEEVPERPSVKISIVESDDEPEPAREEKSLEKLPGDTWFSKSTLDMSKGKRPITFVTENIPTKAIIQADISTSMDLLPHIQYKKMRASKDIRSIVDKVPPLTQRRSSSKNSKPRKSKQVQQMTTDGAK